MDPDSDIVFDFPPFLRLYKSGRVERLIGTDFVPAGVDPATGVVSKDVVIDPATGLSARLYIRCPSSSPNHLPILVYFHGGAFVIESAFSPTYHAFLNDIVAHADVVALSVEYRRAPEHPLPAAYDDCFSALKWVASHASAGEEPWLAERGDFGRVFLAGDSAGANIAHNVLLRTLAEEAWDEKGVKIYGMALIHAYFWGKDPMGSEPTDPSFRQWLETTWGFVCGWSAGIDDPRVDPFRDEAAMRRLPCRRVLVSVTERDWFRDRGKGYYERLLASGWGGEAELVETEDEEHVYFLSKRNCEKASVEMARLVSFLTRD